jgi:DNA-binding transcriptional MerR regulator
MAKLTEVQLFRETRIPREAIRYYINSGLLPVAERSHVAVMFDPEVLRRVHEREQKKRSK